MLDANLHYLHKLSPELTFTVLSNDPEWTSRHYQVAAQRYPIAVNDVDALFASSDGLIISGGGNISSTWPAHTSLRINLINAAYRHGKPAVVLGQTIGPYLSSTDQIQLSDSLGHAALVGLRDHYSVQLVEALGVPLGKIHYQLDDGIFLPEVRPDFDLPYPFIAVTIHPFASQQASPQLLLSLAQQLNNIATTTDCTIVFVPHVATDLTKQLADLMTVPTVILEVHLARIVRWITAQAKMIISTRYHPLVFALASGVPCLGLYSDEYTRVKLRGCLAHAGLEHWSLPISGNVTQAVLEVWKRREQIGVHLASIKSQWQLYHQFHWNKVSQALNLTTATVESLIYEIPMLVPEGEWWRWQQLVSEQDDQQSQLRHSLIEQFIRARREATANKVVLQSREQELSNLKHHVEYLHGSMQESTRYAEATQAVLDARELEMSNLRQYLEGLKQALIEAQEYAQANEKLVVDYGEQIYLLTDARQDAEHYAHSLQATLTAREADLAEVFAYIHSLTESQAKTEHYVHSLQLMLEVKQAEIITLQQALQELQRILDAYKNSFVEK